MNTYIKNKQRLFKLAWPLFVEYLLLMMLGLIDTYMLSTYNDQAAGAVGAATQITSLLNLILLIAASGAGVLIAQYVGAKKERESQQTIIVSLILNLSIGIVVSISIYTLGDPLLKLINVSKDLMPYASDYLKIVGLFIFIQAIMNAVSVALKSYGRTKEVMYTSLFMNILNVLLDAIFIFGLFGIPVLGVKGIAIATVFSRFIALCMMSLFLYKHILYKMLSLKILFKSHITDPASANFKSIKIRFFKSPFFHIAGRIIRIGLPATAEVLSFNLTNIAMTTIMFTYLGQESVIAQTYASKILVFALVFSFAIGHATQIMTGHLIGGGRIEEAYHTVFNNFYIALGFSTFTGALLIFFGKYFAQIFTGNDFILAIAVMALFIDGFLEPGRAFNHVFVYALRGAGDVVFPVVVGVIMGWGLRIGVGSLFAIVFKMGYPGFILGSLIDEWLRGIIMMLRWRNGKWKSKRLI